MEETVLRLGELLFPSIAEVAVLSADGFWPTSRGVVALSNRLGLGAWMTRLAA
ncbi:hypothetical protein ACFYXP_29105 [Streptomyces sp. NPDC002466]|uniref:hypothetical protein n=1 Tax=unclassified Streptomyces TaxID=2593676 RepID=UPI0035E0B059